MKVVLAGPTAAGKSAIALRLAERLGGEIVSVDSMQVYRGLDLGTAKPSAADRARVPHHLIDVVEPSEPFDAARFAELARQAIADIVARGRLPILCGGTGLYFKAVLEGLVPAPPADAGLRSELKATPLETLLAELASRDRETYERIDRKNPRRVIRAVEILRLTGKPPAPPRPREERAATPAMPAAFCLTRTPEDLHRRIEQRVDGMFRDGLVTETQRLLERGLADNPTAMQALGYRQVVEHLGGERSLADTIELVKLRSRQFAKRQLTWFRGQMRLTWIVIEPGQTEAAVADCLADRLGRIISSGQTSSGGSASPSGP